MPKAFSIPANRRVARRTLSFRRPPRRDHQCRGLKVHPEEIERSSIDIPMSDVVVRGRKNPITGAIVVADVVL